MSIYLSSSVGSWKIRQIFVSGKRVNNLAKGVIYGLQCRVFRTFPVGNLKQSSYDRSKQNSDQSINHYSTKEIIKSGVGGFIGMSILSTLHYGLAPGDITTILASFGATSMLVFGFPDTQFAQPKNVIGGHLISCFWGICTSQLVHIQMEAPWLAGPTAVAGSIVLMLSTRLVHPPAGGTALIAALGSKELQDMGFSFLIPTSIGASMLVVVGVLYNNLFKGRSYPKYWL